METKELKDILNSHKKWANGESGTRADLTRADLTGADLTRADLTGAVLFGAKLTRANLFGADLWNAIGNGKEIKTIQTELYTINYTNLFMSIGYERHKIEDWFKFDNNRILKMDGEKALKFWRKWKPILKEILEI